MARYTDLVFPSAREDFAAKHIRRGDKVEEVLDRLAALALDDCINPDKLTPVTSSRVCEFLGWSRESWNQMMNTGSNPRIGPPPPPRAPGKAQRGPGVSDLWFLELDIIPWLMGSTPGRDVLARAVGETLVHHRKRVQVNR